MSKLIVLLALFIIAIQISTVENQASRQSVLWGCCEEWKKNGQDPFRCGTSKMSMYDHIPKSEITWVENNCLSPKVMCSKCLKQHPDDDKNGETNNSKTSGPSSSGTFSLRKFTLVIMPLCVFIGKLFFV